MLKGSTFVEVRFEIGEVEKEGGMMRQHHAHAIAVEVTAIATARSRYARGEGTMQMGGEGYHVVGGISSYHISVTHHQSSRLGIARHCRVRRRRRLGCCLLDETC